MAALVTFLTISAGISSHKVRHNENKLTMNAEALKYPT